MTSNLQNSIQVALHAGAEGGGAKPFVVPLPHPPSNAPSNFEMNAVNRKPQPCCPAVQAREKRVMAQGT